MPSDIASIIDNALSTIDRSNTIVEAAFFGGSFTALSEKVQQSYLQAVQPYLKTGKISGIRLSTRPDCISQPILEMLKAHGVKTIELGVQSFDDDVLRKADRGYEASEVYEACRLIRANAFKLGIQLMIGLPGSSRDKDLYSTDMAIRQKPDLLRIYPTLVIQDTELANLYINGEYEALEVDEAVDIVKEMYLAFQRRAIPVVRMGLHPGEELRSPGTILAGPYHPAFGELVMQEVFKEQAIWLIKDFIGLKQLEKPLTIMVNPRDYSQLVGWKKRNLADLKKSAGTDELLIRATDSVNRGDLALKDGNASKEMVLSRQRFMELRELLVE